MPPFSTLLLRVLIPFVHIISPSLFFVNRVCGLYMLHFCKHLIEKARSKMALVDIICFKISYLFNIFPLSFLISPCYYNDARSDMHFFIFPSFLFLRNAVSELVTRLRRFLLPGGQKMTASGGCRLFSGFTGSSVIAVRPQPSLRGHSSSQAPYPSLPRERESSSISLLVLSKQQTLRWFAIWSRFCLARKKYAKKRRWETK